MKTMSRREGVVVLITLAVLAVPAFLVGGYLVSKYEWATARISEVEPRYARLTGLIEDAQALASAQAQAQSLLAEYVHSSAMEVTQAGNAMQDKIRSVLSTAGLAVVSTQILPVKDENGFQQIPISVRAEGDIMSVQLALAALEEQKPAILVDGFVLQAAAAPVKGTQKLAFQLQLLMLRGAQ